MHSKMGRIAAHVSRAGDGGDVDDGALCLDQMWRREMDEHQRAANVRREHFVEAREVAAAGVALSVHTTIAHRLDVVKMRSAGCIHLCK